MEVTFLEADVPLIKRYTATHKHNYPLVRDFTSHLVEITSLVEFEQQIQARATLGQCLLKGNLDRPISKESRAGHTNADSLTDWICLDVDGMSSVNTIDELMNSIGLSTVSYILQWSSSYGVNNNFDLRAHVYVLLTEPVHPTYLKRWLKQMNLKHFTADLVLAKSHVSLKWGLDISTCQNDKLLYIAPPDCDPPSINTFTGARVTLISKELERTDLNHVHQLTAPLIQQDEVKEINRLRQSLGLKSKAESKYKLKDDAGISYMPNPEHCDVTGVKTARNFTYLNIEHGDSWGYYHPEGNPEFIYNFKGEPVYKAEEFIPAYYQSVTKQITTAKRSAYPTKLFLGFRDFNTATYWNGWYDTALKLVTLKPARSEKQIMDFYSNYNQPEPDPIPIWNKVYKPNQPPVDVTTRTVNTFVPSKFMQATLDADPEIAALPTPIIDHLITHVIGAEMVPQFINWLAHIYQNRTLPKTAWVFHGVQGTGKGIMYYHVLRPLLGNSNATQRRMEELKDSFNAYMEESLLVLIDEAQVSESGKANSIMANLKNQITENRTTIRRMRTDGYEVDNHVGFIFCSNMPDPVVISQGDRRFNVGEYQKNMYTPLDSDLLAIEQVELMRFAHRIALHVIDEHAVRTPLLNQAKIDIQHASMTSSEELAEAIKAGDMEELLDNMPPALPQRDMLEAHDYKNLLLDLLTTGRKNLHRDELFILFNYAVGHVPHNSKKFTKYLEHKGIDIKVMRISGKVGRGYSVDSWMQDQAWFDTALAQHDTAQPIPAGTVTPIK
jgi:hypothetical protein